MNKSLKKSKPATSKPSTHEMAIEKTIYCVIVIIFIAVFSGKVIADEATNSETDSYQYASTKGQTKQYATKTTEQLGSEIKQSSVTNKTKIPLQTRAERIAAKRETLAKNKNSTISPRNGLAQFSIYSASTKLLYDDDYDGYYNTFGVLFDADVLTHTYQAQVYAEIYLSQDGGPWTYLYTTETFTILGDSEDDEYEVVTHLTENYYPDEYDVLIDLYQDGYPGIVASYSAADSALLHALPLESQDWEYDEEYHDDHHGGAFSVLLMLPLILLVIRRKSQKL